MGIKFDVSGYQALRAQHYPVLDVETTKLHFLQYQKQIDNLLHEAELLQVDSDQKNEIATFLGTSAKQIYKKIEEERKFYTEEPATYVRLVNAFVKLYTDKLLRVEQITKAKIATYLALQEAQRREAELEAKRAAADLQEKINAEAQEKGIEPVQITPPIIPSGPNVTRTETGSSHGRKVWTFEIPEPHYFRQLIADLKIQWNKLKEEDTDRNRQAIGNTIATLEALAPYLMISEKEVRNAMKAGVREIPGVRIYQDHRTTFRTP